MRLLWSYECGLTLAYESPAFVTAVSYPQLEEQE